MGSRVFARVDLEVLSGRLRLGGTAFRGRQKNLHRMCDYNCSSGEEATSQSPDAERP
jgi:hypothetical protein